MNNQAILWSILFLPFLTLFFMNKDDLKRYLPVGILSAFASIIVGDIGVTLGFWVHQETAYPLYDIMPFDIGLNMVLTMWLFKFTYRKFGIYLVVNIVLDIVFAYFLFQVYFPNKGMMRLVDISPFQTFLIAVVLAIMLYNYQIWQESIFSHVERSSFFPNLQPAATKPLPKVHENKKENE